MPQVPWWSLFLGDVNAKRSQLRRFPNTGEKPSGESGTRSWKPASHEQKWDLGKMHQALPWVRGHRKRENSSLRKHSAGETDDKQGKKANIWSVLGTH